MSESASGRYRGRFAPSPTGPLHFGSIVAAVGSYLDALAHQGDWLLRIEDVDQGRARAAAEDDILRALERLGFSWQGTVWRQRDRSARYTELLEQLTAAGHAYPCGCTRREIARAARPGVEGLIYPGTCRAGLPAGRAARSLRLRTPAQTIAYHDRVLGEQRQHLADDIGDVILRRADGFVAYQLAVVADDADQGITHIVRGADLALSTPRQILLQQLLGLPADLSYAHLPLALGPDGRKLAKTNHAPPADPAAGLQLLLSAYRFLGQDDHPPLPDRLADFWPWAAARWDMTRVPTAAARPRSEQ